MSVELHEEDQMTLDEGLRRVPVADREPLATTILEQFMLLGAKIDGSFL